MNKKGAEITIGTIIIIILALVVLVVLIYGFITGWGSLWQNVIGFGGGKINVQTVIQSCQIACTTQSYYEYCNRQRNVIFEEKEKGEPMSCEDLESRGVGLICDRVDCEVIMAKDCLALTGDLCKDEENCNVQWMNDGDLANRRKDEMGSDKEWKSIDNVDSGLVKDSKSGETCVKAVLN